MTTWAKKYILSAAGVAGMVGAAGAAKATVFLYDKDNVKAYFGGFTELDVISDTTQGLGEVSGNSAVPLAGSVVGDNGRLVFSPRNSRLAFGVLTNRGAAKVKGHIEADFYGYEPAPGSGVSEAGFYQNPTLRLRSAYFQAEEGGWSVLSGQAWSLFGWQADYAPSTLTVAAISGMVNERTPQITGAKTFGSADDVAVTVALSASRPVQREADVPNADFGVKLAFGHYLAAYNSTNGDVKAVGASIGISGTARQLSHPQLGSKDNVLIRKNVSAVAVNALVPILGVRKGEAVGNTLALAGEYTTGSGYGDQFPGWTGNIANPTGTAATANNPLQPNVDPGVEGYATVDNALTPIKLSTWNANLQYHFPHGWDTWATTGFGQLNALNAKDLKASGTAALYDRSQTAYVNVVHNFNAEIRTGLEYDWIQTRYLNNVFAQNARVQVSTWYRF